MLKRNVTFTSRYKNVFYESSQLSIVKVIDLSTGKVNCSIVSKNGIKDRISEQTADILIAMIGLV